MTTAPSALGELSDRDLLAQVQHAARAERQAIAHLIALLMELDTRRLYLGEGFSSLFTYCRQALERALTLLVTELERRKTAAVERPRSACSMKATPHGRFGNATRHIPAAVKRAVWQRDGGRCAFQGRRGRCAETGFLEYHHVVPFAVGGESSAGNIELRCRAHNSYEADQYCRPTEVPLLRERRATYGTQTQLVPERVVATNAARTAADLAITR